MWLGSVVVRHPWWVLSAWLLAIALGAWGAHRLGQVTLGVEGGVPGSPSRRANEALRTEFTNPFIDPLVVAVSAPGLKVDQAPYFPWVRQATQTLSALGDVRKV